MNTSKKNPIEDLGYKMKPIKFRWIESHPPVEQSHSTVPNVISCYLLPSFGGVFGNRGWNYVVNQGFCFLFGRQCCAGVGSIFSIIQQLRRF